MNIREFNDHILHSKKAHFFACVKLAAETINAPIPKVNFEGCTSFDDELAHIHIDQNKICVSEEYLKRATDEDLRETATHEVTHLIDETHNLSFVKAHSSVKTASWIRKHANNVIDNTKRLNSDCLTPAPKVEKIEPLESLKSQYRILISEIDDCVGKGQLLNRKELLEKVSKVAGEIRAIETPLSETNVEEQTHNPDWVDIENERHNLDLSKISLEEKSTKELTDDIKTHELVSTKKELQEKYIQKNQKENEEHLISVVLNEKYLNSINKAQKREEIEEKKRLINLTKLMSNASVSEGGISSEKANKTIQLLNEDLSNLKKELRELEPEPENTNINAPSESIGIESKEKTIYTEANAEESNRHSHENSKREQEQVFIPKYEAAEILKTTDIPKSESHSRYALFAIIIFIISIISIAIFVGINSNNNTLETSNRTIPVSIPVNDIQQNPGSPIAGTWKFENTQGIVSTIIFDKEDNAILDGKPFKYNIVGSNLVLKDNKSSTAISYKLVDENNLLLNLRGSNNDNYVKVSIVK